MEISVSPNKIVHDFLVYIYEHIWAQGMAIDRPEITVSEAGEPFSADATYFKYVIGL